MSDLKDKLDKLARVFDLPSITEWKQGEFIDSPKYGHMGDTWKHNQRLREKSLIRPGGGTNNALFQVSGSDRDADIAAYLQALGEILEAES